ncbi:DUF3597 family protein [Paraburkholderia sp. BR13439]|uniref:DUF3597 family protein n=1 Tax=Paraburkholderia TaxID=1822464 RepID=UPI0034CEDEA9
MSIFSTVLDKISPHDHPADTASASTMPPAAATASAPGSATEPPAAPSTPSTAAAQAFRPSVTPMPPVDVEAVLTKMQEAGGHQLNWRSSIVDLLKLLGSTAVLRQERSRRLGLDGNRHGSVNADCDRLRRPRCQARSTAR